MTGPTGSGDRDLARETCELSTSAQLRAENEALGEALEAVKRELISERGSYNRLKALYQGTIVAVRQTQKDFAASQSDLTTALAERDQVLDDRDGWKQVAEQLREDGEAIARAADRTREALAEEKRLHARTVAQAAIDGAELASARKELEHRRNLGVELEKLRDIVRRCSACSACPAARRREDGE